MAETEDSEHAVKLQSHGAKEGAGDDGASAGKSVAGPGCCSGMFAVAAALAWSVVVVIEDTAVGAASPHFASVRIIGGVIHLIKEPLLQVTLNGLTGGQILDNEYNWKLLQDAHVCQAPIPKCPINDSTTPQHPQHVLVCCCVFVA